LYNLNAIAQRASRNPNRQAILISSALGLPSNSESRTKIVSSQASRLEDMFAKGTCAVRQGVAFWSTKGGQKMSEAKVTTDHVEIQTWVEARGGHPARVKGTEDEGGSGVLRIDYPGYSGEERLEPISWNEFFEGFEGNKLAFLYQEETQTGAESRFSKLIDRDSVEAKKKAA